MIYRIVILFTLVMTAMAAPASASYESGLYAYSAGDYDTALREWTPLAEGGDARAQYQLGLMALDGKGAAEDDAAALKWFSYAADQGYTPALVHLARLYYTGRGTGHDHNKAARLYEKAARRGNAEAQYALGALYIRGHGVDVDLVQAHMWLSMAGMRGLKIARTRRDEIAAMMSPEQIAEAEKARDQLMGLN